MSTTVTVGGINYNVPAYNDTGWAQGTGNVSQLLIALAAVTASNPSYIQFTAVTTTPVTIISGKSYFVASNTITATLNLPVPVVNTWFEVKDSGNNAAVNNITIHRAGTEKINGIAADKVLTLSGGFWIFACDGTDWYMLHDVESLNPFKSTNQLVITPANGATTSTLNFTAPASSRIYTIPDALSDCQIVMAAGAQTIGGAKTFSGQVATADGTANAPSVAIGTGITNKGIYSSGVDSIGLATAGTIRANLTTTELRSTVNIVAAGGANNLGSTTDYWARCYVGDGLVGTPAITFGADPDTGIYRVAANRMAVVANGSMRIDINDGGNYVYIIGQGRFDNGSGALPAITFNSDTTSGMYLDAGGNLGLATSASNALTIDKTSHAVTFKGTNTNDSAAAGYVGEAVRSAVTQVSAPTTAQWGDLTSISLTAGDWDVSCGTYWEANGGTWTQFLTGISSTTGNSGTGLTFGDNAFVLRVGSTSTVLTEGSLYVGSFRVSISSTTTYYLKYQSVYSAGTPRASGRLSARRVR